MPARWSVRRAHSPKWPRARPPARGSRGAVRCCSDSCWHPWRRWPALAKAANELQEFSRRGTVAAIGSTDYHGMGPVGFCRTYVFVRQRSVQGVIDAIREQHTVAFDRDRFYGEPEFVELATRAGLPRTMPIVPAPGFLRWFSRIGAVLALAASVLGGRR